MNPTFHIDVAIIGGGIAGLWLLAQLRERGYGALLIESNQLGSGQTLCAQGIIHGGTKYRLRGTAGPTQVDGARIALQHNLGLGGACVVTLYGRNA